MRIAARFAHRAQLCPGPLSIPKQPRGGRSRDQNPTPRRSSAPARRTEPSSRGGRWAARTEARWTTSPRVLRTRRPSRKTTSLRDVAAPAGAVPETALERGRSDIATTSRGTSRPGACHSARSSAVALLIQPRDQGAAGLCRTSPRCGGSAVARAVTRARSTPAGPTERALSTGPAATPGTELATARSDGCCCACGGVCGGRRSGLADVRGTAAAQPLRGDERFMSGNKRTGRGRPVTAPLPGLLPRWVSRSLQALIRPGGRPRSDVYTRWHVAARPRYTSRCLTPAKQGHER